MQAYMNINVRVLSAQAQAQIKALQAQVAQLEGQLAKANATSASPTGIGSARSRKSLMAFGNQIQWTGRQLQYNWTLPILLAGGAATKFALDNEKAFTRVKKVYGDTDAAIDFFKKNQASIPDGMNATSAAISAQENELKALQGAFEGLSTRYGVMQKDVLETAGAWAAAGVSGLALAESTELSIKAAVLGDMDLVKATESLIAIQSQYSLSTKQLNLTLAELNAIENQTGISMQGLIDGFSRSAGVAREAGVDVRHLGAMLAALVPATGSATTAGNALKTIISRLMSPTGEAAKVMRQFGVDTSNAAWQSSTAMERLQVLADHMNGTLVKTAEGGYKLSDSQKQVVSSVLGSRYQMNRFLVLMRELGPEVTYYEKALSATADREKTFALATRELNDVLDSNPRRLQIIWATLQNGMANAIQPMIPYILYLAQTVAGLVTKFNSLDPAVQKMVLLFLLLLAAVGPVIKYLGSFLTLVGALTLPIKALVGAWASFATVTKVVDGESKTTRRTLIGMLSTLVKAPFKLIASGFGYVLAAVISLGKGFIGVSKISVASSAVMAAAPAAIAGVWAATSAALLTGWAVLWNAMVVIHTQGVGRLIKTWVVGLALMSKSSAALGGMSAAFSGVFAAISVLFSRQMFIPLIAGMARLTVTLELMWIGLWNSIKYIMVSAQIALLGIMTSMRAALLVGWASVYAGMAAISKAGHSLLIRLYVAFSMALNSVMVAAGLAMRRVWFALHAAMALLSTAFWTQVIRIWIAGAVMLPKILVMARKGITTAWAMIVAAQRSGALAAAAAAAGPWVAIGALILGAIYLFRDQLGQIWDNLVAYFADSSNQMTRMVINAWNALPQGVANALMATVRVVQAAAMQIYEWFSYINPFARHSPSLVDNVTQGMRVVSDQFGLAASAIGGHVKGAYADIKAFGAAIKGLLNGAASFEQAQQRAKIKKFAPGALEEFDQLAGRLKQLQGDLAVLQGRMDKQQAVVDRWTAAVDRANAAIDRQQAKLDRLQKTQQKWQDALAGAQDALDGFASAPIVGMGAMSDKIFENEMAQKRLRLEMMKMEEVGGGLDDIRSKIEAINGAQEALRGEQAALRSAGAGSEILSHYDDQIAALEATKKQQGEAAEAIAELTTELELLERQGEKLDLQNSLKFDPLTRQIEQAAHAMEELPFNEIMAGVQGAAADIEKYQTKLDEATKAVNAQQATVDKLTASRDRLQNRLDLEEQKLSKIKDAYDDVADAIRSVESAMSDASSAAETMAAKAEKAAAKAKKAGAGRKLSPAEQNFMDAAGGNFADVGGAGIPIRTNWEDQSKQIDEFTKKLADEASLAFGDINPFSPLRKKWGQFQSWLKGAWKTTTDAVGNMMGAALGGVGGGDGLGEAADKFRIAWAATSDWFKSNVIKPLRLLWKLFWPSIREFAVNAWNGIKEIWKQIGPVLGELVDEIMKMGPAFQGFWNVLKPVLVLLSARFIAIAKIIFNVVAKTIYPILQTIGNVIENIIQVIKGAVQIVSGFFMLFAPGHFLEGLEKMGAGVLNIFSGTFGAIGQLIWGAVKTIGMAVWGVVDGVIDIFRWMWDVLVGHSIVPDTIDAIVKVFKSLITIVQWLWNNVVLPIFNVFMKLFNGVVMLLKLWWTGVTTAWAVLKFLGLWVWENVLKPVVSFFTSVWSDYVRPALALWWEGVKTVWSGLTTAGKWIWENVLKPIWKAVKRIWEDFVKPGFARWWRGIQNIWSGLKTAAKWMWDNVLKPIWTMVKKLWTDHVRPIFSFYWEGIKKVWQAFKTAGKWVWDNVLKPIWTRVKDLWTYVKDNLGLWWEKIKSIWEKLTGLGAWFKKNVMDKVFDAVTGVWTDIKDWLVKNKGLLTSPIKSIVNVVISAVNAIIKGLNKVADVLPGVDWDINLIEPLAAGGPIAQRSANRGFKTTGARAIVGEGKANYPEFVIPTDPTHRNRAKSLLGMAARKIGVLGTSGGTGIQNSRQLSEHGVPMFGIGGWLGDRYDDVKGGASKLAKEIAKLPRKAVGKIMDPLLDKGIEKVNEKTRGWKPIQSPPKFAIEKLRAWVKDTDKDLGKAIKEHSTPAGGNVSVSDPGSPSGRSIWRGGTFSNRFIAHMQKAEQLAGASVRVMQGGFRPSTSYSGTSHQGDAVDFQVNNDLIRAFRRVGIAAGDRTGLGNWGPHTHAVPGPSSGYGAGSATWQWQDYMAKGGMNQPLTSTWGLKSGGIALARRGPTSALLGDGRHDEAVVPLPKGWRTDLIGSSGEGRTININGDLSFPNIKNGDDAKSFLDNLENLAED